MLSYNRIGYEIDSVKLLPPSEVLGISFLHHFNVDYPETWQFNNNAALNQSIYKFGGCSVYFPDSSSNVTITNTTGMFNVDSLGSYEFEAFVRPSATGGTIFTLDGSFQETAQNTSTLSDYKYYGGHTFKYYSSAVTWANAKAACEALGGHLATSTSAGKNAFLHSIISNNVWLGGIRDGIGSTWEWVTGETWSYTNWNPIWNEPNNTNEAQAYVELYYTDENPATWNDAIAKNTYCYICEWDYELTQDTTSSATTGNLTLSVSDEGVLSLSSTAFDFEGTAATALSADTWHHILLRITDGYVKVFLDRAEVLTKLLYRDGILNPTAVTLGGYVGYMDEFAFRRNAGSSAPTVPTTPYDTNVVIQPIEVLVEVPSATTNNAPVSRAAWSCANLPEGLTLSSAGVLSGHPTTTGTYECLFTVTTNWGIDSKTVKIVVQ